MLVHYGQHITTDYIFINFAALPIVGQFSCHQVWILRALCETLLARYFTVNISTYRDQKEVTAYFDSIKSSSLPIGSIFPIDPCAVCVVFLWYSSYLQKTNMFLKTAYGKKVLSD